MRDPENGDGYGVGTAPFYGDGLAEIRIGKLLAGRPRSEYVLSTQKLKAAKAQAASTSSASTDGSEALRRAANAARSSSGSAGASSSRASNVTRRA